MASGRVKAPIFAISTPCSGASVVFDALSRASGIWRAQTPASFLDTDPGIDPAGNGWDGHRLTAADRERLERPPAELLSATLVDREGRRPEDGRRGLRALATGPRLALRVPLLAAAFPDSKFVVSFREPAATIAEMLIQWRSGQYVVAGELPDWDGPPWSLPLIPGWRELAGRPVEEIVIEQWLSITETMLDDLEALPAKRWAVSDFGALTADPRGELERLCSFLEVPYDQALRTPVEAVARGLQAQPTVIPEALEPLLERTAALAERWRELLPSPAAAGSADADTAGAPTAPTSAGGDSPFRSLSTASFARTLKQLKSSLLITTYQSGRLICARDQQGLLNTHFRSFDKPMGVAVAPGRFALASRTEVWDFRDMPAVAPKVEPKGTHDACYLPRNRHVTGDALMHELAYAGGELWGVATRLSCLVTFDQDNSVVPRWKPPFIKQISAGDNCHLNGLCVVEDRPAYVTALGTTDEPGAWRADKASGGVLMDVASSEIVCSGLSMPHSPRMHEGRMYLLESGKGEVVTVDLDTGRTETVVELPGFTRGFSLHGNYAFVGLSQIRESSTFGDLPLTQRLRERVCGVWLIHLGRGKVLGFLRFEDLVQEIFDVSLLPGARFPEIAEPGSTAVSESFVLP